MTERSSTTESVRRRIGDRGSGNFPPPAPAPAQGRSDDTEAAPNPGPAADSATVAAPGAAAVPAHGGRQIIVAPDSSRNLGGIHSHNATAPSAAADPGPAPPAGPAQGRRSIADRANPQPAAPTASGAVATADRPRDEIGVDDRPTRTTRTTVLVGALVVVLLATTIFFGLKWRGQDNLNGLRSSALSTATSDGVLLSSYDYRNLTGPGSSFGQVLKNATPAFRKSFQSTSGTLDKLLSQYNATATGKVISAGVASFSSTRAVVLLFIDQTVNNSVQKSASATQPLRTQVTLLRQNGKWLIDDLQVPK
ncbi:MAG: hypothetical protein ACR2MN_09775 [Acidimicrobiales bacterium]